jgi:hypothetical protein
MGKRTIFSKNGAGITVYPHAQDWIWAPTSHHVKINLESMRPKDKSELHKNLCIKHKGHIFMSLD